MTGQCEVRAVGRAMQRAIEEIDDTHCTCGMTSVNSASIDPPERKTNRHCPVHGNLAARDPDAARERERDDRGWDGPREDVEDPGF